MDQMNDTTYIAPASEEPIEAVIGDEQQEEFYPRLKLKKWNNEANLSIGILGNNGTVQTIQDSIIYTEGDMEAIFAPVKPRDLDGTAIRYIKTGAATPLRISALYELDRHVKWPRQTINLHWAEEYSMMYYGYYPKTKFIDPEKIDLPETRLSSWRAENGPMVMDPNLILIDIHYDERRDDTELIHKSMKAAIKSILWSYGCRTVTEGSNGMKLYFRNTDGENVKFFSTAFVEGHYYFYINLGLDYNQSHNYYWDDVQPTTQDTLAYGLRSRYDIPDVAIDQIITKYAQLYGLPLVNDTFTQQEESELQRLEALLSDQQWIEDGVREDPFYTSAWEDEAEGFTFDFRLNSRPDSNVIPFSITTKELEFRYQGELTQAEKDAGDWRPPRVVGSYAAYIKGKRDNQYKTGKAFHLYRPWVEDADKNRVWCDLNIDLDDDGNPISDTITLVIPQSFLDNAIYPVYVDPTFGYSTVGASNTDLKDKILSTTQTYSGVGALAGIFLYQSVTLTGTLQYQAALYDSSGNLLLQGEDFTTITGVGANWYGSNFPTRPVLASQDYRLAVTGTGVQYSGNAQIAYDSTGGKTSHSYSQTYAADSFPSNMSSFTTESNRQYSIYAYYGYQFPIPVASSVAMAGTNRFLPLMGAYDNAWSTTEINNSNRGASAIAFHDIKMNLTTAPGAGTTRTLGVREGAATGLIFDIADTATSGSNNAVILDAFAGTQLAWGNIAKVGSPASSTVNRWRMLQTGEYQWWGFSSIATVSTTANRFMEVQGGVGANSATGPATQIMPESGTLRNFYAGMSATLSAGSYTLTLVKNGVDTSVVIVLDSTNQNNSYTAGTVTVATGDTLYWKIVPSAGTAPSAAVRIYGGLDYQSDVAGNGVILSNQNASASASATVYNWGFGGGAWNATESNVQALGAQMRVTKLYVVASAAAGASKSRTVTMRRNTADTTVSVQISGASQVNGTWTGDVPVYDDDLLSFSQVPSGTPTAASVKYGIVFTAIVPKYTKTHTTNALLLIRTTKTHTSNALLLKRATASHTTDAYLQSGAAPSYTKTHSSDALLLARATKTHTADALLLKVATKTHTSDALLAARATKTHSTNALLLKRATATHTADSLLLKQTTRIHTTDAYLSTGVVTLTVSHTSNALLLARITKTHTSDALLLSRATKTHTSNALLFARTTKAHTSDSLLLSRALKTHTSDTLLLAVVTKTHTTDAVLVNRYTVSGTSDALLLARVTKTHASDALLLAQQIKTHTTNALLLVRITTTHTADSYIIRRVEATHATDALLLARRTVQSSSDALLAIRTTKSHSTNALIGRRLTQTHTTSAYLKVVDYREKPAMRPSVKNPRMSYKNNPPRVVSGEEKPRAIARDYLI